jgi:8-oxo-dGTP diphosphatase
MKTVTAAIICDAGRVLLTRRGPAEKLSGLWEFPGGKVEAEETLEQCLTRELLEELGLEVSVGGVVAESVYSYAHGSIRLVAMEATILSGHLTLTVHDQAEWVLPEAFVQFALAPADVPIATAVQRLLIERAEKNSSLSTR